MSAPKTIKIFLIDGDPSGLRIVDVSNWNVQAVVIPRNKLKDAKLRPECKKPAVYFLIGKESEEALLFTVYIGEAGNLWDRLYTQDTSKRFWQTAIAFISKDEHLTKAHVKYLESRSLFIAREVKRCNIENQAESSTPSLPESDIADMDEYLKYLELLLSSLGYPILQAIVSKESQSTSDPLFIFRGKGAKATGRLTNDGFVVYSGSTATVNLTKAVADKNARVLAQLLEEGFVEKRNDNLYHFVKDYVFNSPSAASNIIYGNATSGWKMWKTSSGDTLEQIYKKLER